MQRTTTISVCVIAVSKSHEVLLKVRRLDWFFFDDDAYAFTSMRRNFFPRRRKRFDFDDESMFFHDVGHSFVIYYSVSLFGYGGAGYMITGYLLL